MSVFEHLKDMDPSNGPMVFVYKLNEEIARSLKTLMEEKGLYQSVAIDRESALQFTLERVMQFGVRDVEVKVNRQYPDWVNLTLSEEVVHIEGSNKSKVPVPTIIPVNFKLYCSKCKRTEAFKPLWFQDITNAVTLQHLGSRTGQVPKIPNGLQLFSLLYQCQSCLGAPESFLIRRWGLKLAMHGRSPIESVSVPQSIPEPESNWYRESLIAMKFGKLLAAIFFLRVFIEQFARRVTAITDRRPGDEILAEYNSTIDDPPRSTMPSLKEWYSKLSEAIHSANEDQGLIEEAFREVERHFSFRSLYKMSEPQPKDRKAVPPQENSTSEEQ